MDDWTLNQAQDDGGMRIHAVDVSAPLARLIRSSLTKLRLQNTLLQDFHFMKAQRLRSGWLDPESRSGRRDEAVNKP